MTGFRIAAVTGAGGGIGTAVCDAFQAAEIPVTRLAHDKGLGWDVLDHVPRLAENLYADYLVCCHAAPIGSSFIQQMTIDLVGAYYSCMGFLPYMMERRFGRIVLLGSIRAQHPRPSGQVAYAAAKAGTEGLARALAAEYGRHGITVNVVAPGAVDTPRTRANIAAGTVSEAELVARTPAGRLATVEDVAAAVLWLCGDGAGMVNGQTIVVDGGWSVSG